MATNKNFTKFKNKMKIRFESYPALLKVIEGLIMATQKQEDSHVLNISTESKGLSISSDLVVTVNGERLVCNSIVIDPIEQDSMITATIKLA